MATADERYLDLLLERIRADRYPSGGLMDRLEALMTDPEQAERYAQVLLEKAAETHYASGQMLDRIERVLSRA